VRASTLEELAREPAGRYLAGESWLHFCATPTLWGVILWGRPDESEAARLGRSLVLELQPPAVVHHASIVDASRLEGSDPSAFRAAERYLTHYGEVLAKWVSKLALLRPRGLQGATVAGAYEVLPRPYPVAVFDRPAAAFQWLGAPPVDLDALHAEATGTPHLVGALRALLDEKLRLPVAEAASRLGISERSLQRKLGEAQTSFHEELAEARIRAARRLLLESDAPLTAIAYDVGCASLQHFSALFRKRTGESPSAFRARLRK
jgi:AraC-like DNA-binding protein